MPKPRVGVVGTDMEWGPMGELMTEKGGPMPLMGELRVLMGECSCPGEPSEEGPIPGPREGCSEGAAMEPRPVGELRDEEFTWVEKSARQEPTGGWSGMHRLACYPQATDTTGGHRARESRPWARPWVPPAPWLTDRNSVDTGQGQGVQSAPPRQPPNPHSPSPL